MVQTMNLAEKLQLGQLICSAILVICVLTVIVKVSIDDAIDDAVDDARRTADR